MDPMKTLPRDWKPDYNTRSWLTKQYGKWVDLDLSLTRFVAHHQQGQTARNWNAMFVSWVVGDVARARPNGGTDEHGVPHGQQPSTTQPLKPGDPGYTTLDDLADEARKQAES